ncbi:MAG: membrane protein insertase YidC [Bryobacteraceae bacterium]
MDPNSGNKEIGSGKKELSMEARLMIAFGLMAVVLFVTPYIYKPAPPPADKKTQQTEEKKAALPAEQPPAEKAKTPAKPAGPKAALEAAAVPAAGVIQASKEELYTVNTKVYKVVFSNRGAVVKSWILKKYKDHRDKPLDLVNPRAAEKTDNGPFSLLFKNQKPSFDPNWVNFVAKPAADNLGIDFEYSDGSTVVRKSFKFDPASYTADVSTEVLMNGVALPHLIEWRGGFGDPTIVNAQASGHSLYHVTGESSPTVKDVKAGKDGPVTTSGTYSFAGLEDPYFTAVFLPKGNGSTTVTTFSDTVIGAPEGAGEEPHIGVAIGGDGENRFTLFVGPKDLDLMKQINPKLEQLVDWGWFGFIAKPLFAGLNWLNDKYIHNYGWAIILLTVIINIVLMPLKFTSMKSAKKMQTLQPQIAAINAKYKEIPMRDPRQSDKNAEVMELYKKNGVNPVGGCLPMVLQLPFFFAFYKVLTVSVEMRGAPWLWVGDLSQPETLSLRVLPVLLIITQFVSQKMTPAAGADPSQQKIMMFMPLAMGFMFYYQSAGLVLYWLTGNLVAIAQQWFTNRTMATPAPAVIDVKPGKKK